MVDPISLTAIGAGVIAAAWGVRSLWKKTVLPKIAPRSESFAKVTVRLHGQEIVIDGTHHLRPEEIQELLEAMKDTKPKTIDDGESEPRSKE